MPLRLHKAQSASVMLVITLKLTESSTLNHVAQFSILADRAIMIYFAQLIACTVAVCIASGEKCNLFIC